MTTKRSKLHQLLAVFDSLKNQGSVTLADLKNTFEKKKHHFSKSIKTYTPNTEGAETEVEEVSDIQTTVKDELTWISAKIAKAIDIGHQIDEGNMSARADVILADGTVILQSVPATSLLQMEKHLTNVHDLIKAIPTLDPAKGFTPDGDNKNGIFKAREVRKGRTKKVEEPLIIVPATKEFPAQAKTVTVDKVVGIILEQEWSSLITPQMKGQIIDRAEELLRAVKAARAVANEAEVDTEALRIGGTLMAHIFTPINN